MKRFSLRFLLVCFTLCIIFAAIYAIGKRRSEARKQLVETGFILAFDRESIYRGFVNYGFLGGPEVVLEPEGEIVDAPQCSKWLVRLGLDPFASPIKYLDGSRLEAAKRASAGFKDEDLLPVSNLSALEEALLENNSLTDDSLKTLGQLKNLEVLDLSNNEISDDGLRHLAGLQKLKRLVLDSNRVSDSSLSRIKSMPSLEHLSLVGTDVDGSFLINMKSVSTLKSLDLSGCDNLAPEHLLAISKMKSLEALSLHGTKADDSLGPVISKLEKLSTLDLGYTQVGDAFFKAIDGMNLSWLEIDETQVSDKSVPTILKMTHLEYFSSYESRISLKQDMIIEDQIERLEEENYQRTFDENQQD